MKNKLFVLGLTAIIGLSTVGCGTQRAEEKRADTEDKTVEEILGKVTKDAINKGFKYTESATGEIDVSVYDGILYGPYVQEAAKLFETKYPGTKVNVKLETEMPKPQTSTSDDGTEVQMFTVGDDNEKKEEYINKVNTELMSGEGADVYAMDALPYKKFADAGQLEDLTPYMEADENFNMEDYQQNIIEGVGYQGKQYMLPVEYAFDYLSYDTKLLNEEAKEALLDKKELTMEDLVDIAKKAYDNQEGDKEEVNKLFNLEGGQGLFNKYFDESYSKFIDLKNNKVDFDNQAFRGLLEKIKDYEEKGYVKEAMDFSDPAKLMAQLTSQAEPKKFFYELNYATKLITEYAKSNSMQVMMGGFSNTEDHKASVVMKNSQGGSNFSVSQGYGMNANSKNKKLAWAFLKFLISEEMQASMNLRGEGVNKKAMEEATKLKIAGQFFTETRANNIDELTKEQEEIFNTYKSHMQGYIQQLDTYLLRDPRIDDMMYEEVAAFFEGKKSAREVGKTLQSKVSLYLNE